MVEAGMDWFYNHYKDHEYNLMGMATKTLAGTPYRSSTSLNFLSDDVTPDSSMPSYYDHNCDFDVNGAEVIDAQLIGMI